MVRPVEVAARWTHALSEHDLEAAVACFHPQYRDHAPARRGEVAQGCATTAYRRVTAGLSRSDLRLSSS